MEQGGGLTSYSFGAPTRREAYRSTSVISAVSGHGADSAAGCSSAAVAVSCSCCGSGSGSTAAAVSCERSSRGRSDWAARLSCCGCGVLSVPSSMRWPCASSRSPLKRLDADDAPVDDSLRRRGGRSSVLLPSPAAESGREVSPPRAADSRRSLSKAGDRERASPAEGGAAARFHGRGGTGGGTRRSRGPRGRPAGVDERRWLDGTGGLGAEWTLDELEDSSWWSFGPSSNDEVEEENELKVAWRDRNCATLEGSSSSWISGWS